MTGGRRGRGTRWREEEGNQEEGEEGRKWKRRGEAKAIQRENFAASEFCKNDIIFNKHINIL
jgi:hypothetical protein